MLKDEKHEISSLLSHHLFKLMIYLLSQIEKEKIIIQIIGIGKNCDQSGDRVICNLSLPYL